MRIAVANQTFGKDPILRGELQALFPDCVFNEKSGRLTEDELASLLKECDGAVIGLELVGARLLRRCPRLKIISKYGVGLDNIDTAACERQGIAVGWTPGLNKLAVAEMTLALILGLLRDVVYTCHKLKAGVWEKTIGAELTGKTIGIVGVGHVGKELIRLLKPFNCLILANDIVDQRAFYRRHGIMAASKARIWRKSDIITLHTPLTARTRNLVDREVLRQMKRTALLVNTARGPIVEQKALKWALGNGIIAGAALDVYCDEPPTDSEFLSLPRLLCTPHRAGSSREAVLAMGRSAIAHLRNHFLEKAAARER